MNRQRSRRNALLWWLVAVLVLAVAYAIVYQVVWSGLPRIEGMPGSVAGEAPGVWTAYFGLLCGGLVLVLAAVVSLVVILVRTRREAPREK